MTAGKIVAILEDNERRTIAAVEFLADGVILEFEGGGTRFVPMPARNRGFLEWHLRTGIKGTVNVPSFEPKTVH